MEEGVFDRRAKIRAQVNVKEEGLCGRESKFEGGRSQKPTRQVLCGARLPAK